MDVNQWIMCFSKAYDATGKAFLPRTKETLSQQLSLDSINNFKVYKVLFQSGTLPEPVEIEDESQNEVIEEAGEVITRCFFRKAALGETFGPINRVSEKFGSSIEENYGLSRGTFINMAKTYWTYKIEVQDLFPKYHNLLLAQVLLKVERDIASVFFPTPGPTVIWVRQRREMQRQLLKQYASEIDIDAFLENNPILGTSEGPVAGRVVNEKITIRCPNSNCPYILRVPNTVRTLQVTCPKCRTSFRFPVKELQWLNQLRPDIHPEPCKVDELETLRQIYDIPPEIFAMLILGSPWTTRRIQENIYGQYRKEMPKATEKELLKAVFASRALPPVPFGLGMTEEEMDRAMESINSLEELVTYFIKRDEAEKPLAPDILGIGEKIDEILSR